MSSTPFSHEKESAHDLETYWGRFHHFQAIIDPRNLLYSNSTLVKYSEILRNHKNGKLDKIKDDELWHMKYVIWSNVHPQTEEPLPLLFRTSGFVPINIPLVIGLSILPPTPFNQFFSQTLNQTYNFAFNYANRNVSNHFSNTQLLFSYFAACSCAIGVSIGLATAFRRMNFGPSLKYALVRVSPLLGVASANICNLFCSRYQDFTKGIKLMDKETRTEIEGHYSVKAAKKAFWQTALTRILIPIPIFFIPNIYISVLRNMQLLPKNRILSLINNSAISAFSLYVGLSGSIAIFPQTGFIHHSQLEKEFHDLKNKNGQKIEWFAFNKGL